MLFHCDKFNKNCIFCRVSRRFGIITVFIFSAAHIHTSRTSIFYKSKTCCCASFFLSPRRCVGIYKIRPSYTVKYLKVFSINIKFFVFRLSTECKQKSKKSTEEKWMKSGKQTLCMIEVLWVSGFEVMENFRIQHSDLCILLIWSYMYIIV